MSNIQKFKFDTRSINVTTDEHGETWFSAKEVCEVLGYANPKQTLDDHVDPEDVSKRYTLTAGGQQQTNHVNESGLYSLILGSKKDEAKRFKRWVTSEVLPTIRKTGSYSTNKSMEEGKAAAAVLILRAAAEDLKLSQASVLGGYQRIAQQAGVPDLLPSYAVDAPKSDIAGSSEPTKSLTDLLREHGSPFSARDFNCELLYLGVIEERVRPSSKGGVKKFKVLVDMEYGKNITSPNNQRESAPHYYPSRFGELLSRVEESYF